jgi:hypothetical protein
MWSPSAPPLGPVSSIHHVWPSSASRSLSRPARDHLAWCCRSRLPPRARPNPGIAMLRPNPAMVALLPPTPPWSCSTPSLRLCSHRWLRHGHALLEPMPMFPLVTPPWPCFAPTPCLCACLQPSRGCARFLHGHARPHHARPRRAMKLLYGAAGVVELFS